MNMLNEHKLSMKHNISEVDQGNPLQNQTSDMVVVISATDIICNIREI